MCTVSWQWKTQSATAEKQLRIYFNRDERRTRQVAQLPSIVHLGGYDLLYPTDPDRGGTWIATNSVSLTVALLNNYSVPISPDKAYESRGQLVKQVSLANTAEQAIEHVKRCVDNYSYPAFSLLIWDYHQQRTILFEWNESELKQTVPEESFLTSSSWNTPEVQAFRRQQFIKYVINGQTSAADFHATETPDMVEHSVFMSREFTQTVSRTYITVDPSSTTMEYYDRSSNQTSLHTLPSSQASN